MAKLFQNQLYGSKDFRGLVGTPDLYSVYQQTPQLLPMLTREIYKQNLPGSLVSWQKAFPSISVEQENGFYQWNLKNQDDKNFPLLDAETESGDSVSAGTFPSVIGANREHFFLYFEAEVAQPTDFIRGELHNVYYYVHNVKPQGNRYQYEVTLLNDDESLNVDSVHLAINKRFTKFGNVQPARLSYRGSTPWFSSPFRMENRLASIRMEMTVSGEMIRKGKNEPLVFPFRFKGIESEAYVNFMDMLTIYQSEELFARSVIYGNKNWKTNTGYLDFDQNNNQEIVSPMGLFSQIAPGNVHLYNTLDIDYIVDMALDMSIGKIGRGNRRLSIVTGERGAIALSKQIDLKQKSKWNAVIMPEKVIRKGNASNLGTQNPLHFGYQYTGLDTYNGVTLDITILDFLDDDVYFPERDPNGQGTLESHRMFVMGWGESADIYNVKLKGEEEMIFGCIAGLRDPYSPAGSSRTSPKMMASSIDGYITHCKKTGGMVMTDPTKVLEFRKNVQY